MTDSTILIEPASDAEVALMKRHAENDDCLSVPTNSAMLLALIARIHSDATELTTLLERCEKVEAQRDGYAKSLHDAQYQLKKVQSRHDYQANQVEFWRDGARKEGARAEAAEAKVKDLERQLTRTRLRGAIDDWN